MPFSLINAPHTPQFFLHFAVSRQVWFNPEADKLFFEEINVGEEGGPCQIASMLWEHYSLEDM